MQGVKVSIVVVFAAIFLFACAGERANKLSVQESRRVEASFFRQNCQVCHGREAEGGILTTRAVPSLREGEVVRKSDEHLREQITHGGNGMPPFKHQLTEKQIENMVAFIRALQRPDF